MGKRKRSESSMNKESKNNMKQVDMNDEEKIEKVMDLIIRHGGHDGEHHKEWCIDQVFRILSGNEYDNIVNEIRKNDYSWKIGIAP